MRAPNCRTVVIAAAITLCSIAVAYIVVAHTPPRYACNPATLSLHDRQAAEFLARRTDCGIVLSPSLEMTPDSTVETSHDRSLTLQQMTLDLPEVPAIGMPAIVRVANENEHEQRQMLDGITVCPHSLKPPQEPSLIVPEIAMPFSGRGVKEPPAPQIKQTEYEPPQFEEPAPLLQLIGTNAPRVANLTQPDEQSQAGSWWEAIVTQPVRPAATPRPIELGDVILSALRHSPRVRAISDIPLIRETAITESEAQFDWRAFMESRFTDTSDPVGSTLATGGPRRLINQNWRYSAGLRRRTFGGGQLEVAQRIGLEDSNSQFFVPENQANSRLALNFTQPLLNGAGRVYNASLIMLAQIDTDAANDEFIKQLQDHLLEITRTYWDLYLNRAVLLQKRQVHAHALAIMQELEARRDIDSLASQIVRARSAVATRQAEILHCEMAIRNTESKLRALVNDPDLMPNDQVELLPAESPSGQAINVNISDSLATALQHRPEIDQATLNVRAATVRLGLSKKELQPVLDFVAEAYASGLEGDYALAKAYGNQFSVGRPSYSVGLVFELPLGNREARARYQRRQLELRQLANELQNVIETTKAEVEIAVRHVDTLFGEVQSKFEAVLATGEEVQYLHDRWRQLPGDDQAASFLLEDLLGAQERLADAEYDYVSAQVAYTVSIFELKRAMGTLLEAENIEVSRTCDETGPALHLDMQQ